MQRIDLFLYNFFCTRLITFLFFSFFLVTDVPPSTQPAENIFSVAFLFFSFFTSCNCFLFVSRRLFLAFGFFLPLAFSCLWLFLVFDPPYIAHSMQKFLYFFRAALVCSIFVSVSVMFLFLSAVSELFQTVFRPVCLLTLLKPLEFFIAFVTPRRTVHKHCTGFYLASIDLL